VTTPQVLPQPPIRPEPPAPPAPPGEVLPATGAELALMGLVALALVLAGIVLSFLGRKEDEPGT
jgi:LPXTG-motif cell wall-anchored protein